MNYWCTFLKNIYLLTPYQVFSRMLIAQFSEINIFSINGPLLFENKSLAKETAYIKFLVQIHSPQ